MRRATRNNKLSLSVGLARRSELLLRDDRHIEDFNIFFPTSTDYWPLATGLSISLIPISVAQISSLPR
jgi:hypothetical protein